MESNWKEDFDKEKQWHKFLTERFYDVAVKHNYLSSYTTITDKRTQKEGVDTIVRTYSGKTILVDEKTCLDYINCNLPTFAFELLNGNSGAIGWLLNDDLKTTHYLLCWSNKDSKEFISGELMLISKDKVLELLASYGYTKQWLKNKIPSFLSGDVNKEILLKDAYDKPIIYLVKSPDKKEVPVNIVVNKKLLRPCCEFNIIVGDRKCSYCGAPLVENKYKKLECPKKCLLPGKHIRIFAMDKPKIFSLSFFRN